MKRIFAVFFIFVLCIGLFASCSSDSDNGDAVIRIATKPMVEQYILGEILALIIEDATGFSVEVTKGIAGGTSNIHPAMVRGDFDLYPEYTSTGYIMVLGRSAAGVSNDEIWDNLIREYAERYDMIWVGLYGFNNTFCIVVRGDVARRYNLQTTSDLAAVAGGLVFGGNPDYFEREDGFPALVRTYGLEFARIVELDIGLRFVALESGDIDVTTGFTTDAQLAAHDVVILEDDLGLHVSYYASTIVRNDALEKFPGLYEALMIMDGLISDSEMLRMNHAVAIEGQDERDVARAFLIEKGVLSQ